jgi:arginase family enzyme
VVGAPFDGRTSHRPGGRFGPVVIRQSVAWLRTVPAPTSTLRVDALQDLRVLDAGDVEMYSGDVEAGIAALVDAVHPVSSAGAVPLVPGGDHTIGLPDATGLPLRRRLRPRARRARPGPGTPEPGGRSTRQLLDAVRRVCLELPVVGMGIVEVSPP